MDLGMVYAVFRSVTFDDELKKKPKEFLTWLNKVEDQLKVNPYVGDHVKVKWFREKRYKKFRIYYLIYDDIKAVYLVGMSDKKDQQKVIDTIWFLVDIFKDEIQNIVKK